MQDPGCGVIGVMQMRNIVPKAGFKPTPSCHSGDSMITITRPRLPDAFTLSVAPYPCGWLPEITTLSCLGMYLFHAVVPVVYIVEPPIVFDKTTEMHGLSVL